MAAELEFAYKAADARKTVVLHAMGHPRLGAHISPCGKTLGGAVAKERRGLYRKCEQCFIQGTAAAMTKKKEAVYGPAPAKKKERAVYPGLLVQNSRHVRRQLAKFAERYPDFSIWALQQDRYLKAGLDEIGAAE